MRVDRGTIVETIRLTTAQAIVRWLVNQRTAVDGEEIPLFAGVFGIFGHGNVTCLAEALERVQDELPTWRDVLVKPPAERSALLRDPDVRLMLEVREAQG